MPSLMMKKCSSREKSCVRVCHKSCTITKKSSCHLKISQLAADATLCEICHDVKTNIGLNIHDAGVVEAISQEVHFKQLPTASDDSAVSEGMVSHSVSCSSDLKTIFSPSPVQNDIHDVPEPCDNRGTTTPDTIIEAPLELCGSNVDHNSFLLGTTDESDGNSGSSSDHQTCNISDFYVSDMVLAGLPFDGGFVYDDFAQSLMFPEYDTAESNIFFDVMERHIPLPFHDGTVASSEIPDVRSSEEARTDCDSSSFLLAIHQVCPGDQQADFRPYVEFDETQYFDPHSFIKNMPDLSDVPADGPTILPKESRERKPITLVLDLDETLVHSTLEHCEDADFTFTVFFNMREHTVYVKERPHLHTFLKKVAGMFEIVVFTASQSIYAEQLLDILDPEGKLISGRAYRESCIFSDGSYTKDLTVLGLNLAKVVIIDNSPQVFRLQINNGIPIKSWFDDTSDKELISLIPFLETLAEVDDVRPLIAKRFGNKE